MVSKRWSTRHSARPVKLRVPATTRLKSLSLLSCQRPVHRARLSRCPAGLCSEGLVFREIDFLAKLVGGLSGANALFNLLQHLAQIAALPFDSLHAPKVAMTGHDDFGV